MHVGWNMVKEIHKKYLKAKYSYPDIKQVHRIGIDEFATRKGHVYKTIVVDLDTGRIIHVGDGKGKDALAGFWKRVKRNKVKIEVVTSDLSAAFIASVMENAHETVHVYDKFHVSKLVNDAVDAVRRKVYAQETDLEKRNIIKGSRWLPLTKDKDIFDDDKKKRLDNNPANQHAIVSCVLLKEDLDQIWMQDNKEDAEKQLCYCKTCCRGGHYDRRKFPLSLYRLEYNHNQPVGHQGCLGHSSLQVDRGWYSVWCSASEFESNPVAHRGYRVCQ